MFNLASVLLSPLDIKLDTTNPRFLNAQIDEDGAIKYLLKYSKIIELAQSIVANGGLYVGERIVAFQNDDGTYKVLEGNRRTCACKLLLSRNLIPSSHQGIFPVSNQDVINNISSLEVDVVTSIEEAERFIASRHIDSILLWSPIAKMKFFADRFNAGQTLQNIAEATRTSISKIKRDIKDYNLLMYALNLPCWTPEEKENKLNIFDLEIDKFLRIYRTAGASRAFGLQYNDVLNPSSSLGQTVFDSITQRIMYCAYITDKQNEKISTRTDNWEKVPGLKAIIDAANNVNPPNPSPTNTNTTRNTQGSSNSNARTTNTTSNPTSQSNSSTNSSQSSQTSQSSNNSSNPRPATPTHARNNLIPATCILNINNPKLRNIYSELQTLNIDKFTNSAAITFRVFFDLTIEMYVDDNHLTIPQQRPNLTDKYNAVLNDLQQKNLLLQRDANALRQLTSNNQQAPTILSIVNFHDYVHRTNYQPTPRDLNIIWDNVQNLFQIIYS